MNSKNLLTGFAVTVMAAIGPVGAQRAEAASPEVETAVQTISEIAADATKLQAYCAIVKEMDAVVGDQAKYEALVAKLEDLLRSFGPKYERMMELMKSADLEQLGLRAVPANRAVWQAQPQRRRLLAPPLHGLRY